MLSTDGPLILFHKVEDFRLDDSLFPLEVLVVIKDNIVVHVSITYMAVKRIKRPFSKTIGVDLEDEFFKESGWET